MNFAPLRNILSHDRSGVIVILSIVAASLIAGVIYTASLGGELPYADERDYLTLARMIAERGMYSFDGIHPTAYRPPGYPLFLALFTSIGFDVVHLRVLNVLLLASSNILLTATVIRRAGITAGVLCSLLFALYPILYYTAGTLYPQTFGMFLLAAFCWLLFTQRLSTPLYGILAGLVAGIMLLTIPSMIVVLGTAVFVAGYRWKRRGSALLMVLSAAIVMSPWIFRNYAVFDTFVPFSTNTGINLLLGNSPKTLPASGVNVDLSEYRAAEGMSEIQKNEYYRSEAIHYIVRHPAEAFQSYLLKTLHYFHFRNTLATPSQQSVLHDLVMAFTYWPLLLVGIIRVVFWKKYPPSDMELFFIAVYLASALFHGIFFTRIRFRVPYDAMIIGVAAIFLSSVLTNRKRSTKDLQATVGQR